MLKPQTSTASTRTALCWARGAVLLAVTVGLAASGARAAKSAEKRDAPSAKDQLQFGVEMAQRGLWSEALFRFRQADRLDPENPTIFNNLAVAHEALGLFEEALEYYRKALRLDPSNRGLKRNYARFVEFYQSFKPPEEEGEEQPAVPSETAPP